MLQNHPNLVARNSAAGGFYPYTINNSVFTGDGTKYIYHTGALASTPTDRKKLTLSFWFKKSNFYSQTSQTDYFYLGMNTGYPTVGIYDHSSGDQIEFVNYRPSPEPRYMMHTDSDMAFRDVSAWYHMFLVVDTTLSTATDRYRIYVNGSEITHTWRNQSSDTPQNIEFHFFNLAKYAIGAYINPNTAAYDPRGNGYYLAEYHAVDGTAYAPTDFGEFKNGVWIPKEATGISYGNGGFYLDFADSSDLGKDVSGNANHFSTSGMSSSDQMTDTPTNNFPTMNPVFKSYYRTTDMTLAEGNLKTSGNTSASAGHITRWATQYFDTNDNTGYYFEVYIRSRSYYASSNNSWGFEFVDSTGNNSIGNNGTCVGLLDVDTTKSQIRENGSITFDNLTSVATGNVVIGFAIKGNKVWMHRAGTWFNSGDPAGGTGQIATLSDGLYRFGISGYGGGASNSYTSTSDINFGQNGAFNGQLTAGGNADENGYGDFYYSPPSGFLALCTANLPEPTIGPNSTTTSGENFNTVLYTGNGSTQSITGVGFQPDWIWVKDRDTTNNHLMTDVTRGVNSQTSPSTVTNYTATNAITSFDADGFSLGSDSQHNTSGNDYVAWNWKLANGTSSNTDGSITSTVSVNTDAGISIAEFTASVGSIGHGLGVTPDMVWYKDYNAGNQNWFVWLPTLFGNTSDYLRLSLTAVTDTVSTYLTGINSTTASIGADIIPGPGNKDTIMHFFKEVEGFSKFGSYTGNGSSDGTFIYTGFRPAWIMFKRTDSTSGGDWLVLDSTREPYNVVGDYRLYANSSVAESSNDTVDFLSNGFKMRGSTAGELNASGGTYIYICFSEAPLKYSNAR